MRTWWDGMPRAIRSEVEKEGISLSLLEGPEPAIDCAHIFVTEYKQMKEKLEALRPLLSPAGFIWVSWPKKSSGVVSDISEDRIRDAIAGQSGLVDVKVCAVDRVWSGLKLMIRRERR
jgi:hypothetical protein